MVFQSLKCFCASDLSPPSLLTPPPPPFPPPTLHPSPPPPFPRLDPPQQNIDDLRASTDHEHHLVVVRRERPHAVNHVACGFHHMLNDPVTHSRDPREDGRQLVTRVPGNSAHGHSGQHSFPVLLAS
ncbi:hypothetical protein BaRGS_00018192 [Batillaria attramentaria]|uniref:Uncharacterized protein n=1 Tax=Batillaria attramentaria TaxID=370345 RepID=A0ABD0KTS3_9CAEN